MAQSIKIMTHNIAPAAKAQVESLSQSAAFADADIRIMPDVHAGKGSVVGFTARNVNHIIPNVIGVDIGCGMLTISLGPIDIDYAKLDETIRQHIPHGFATHEYERDYPALKRLRVYYQLKNVPHLLKSLGTLGGGNHFIEIGEDENQNKYLIIHTGSRNLGTQVATIYQNKAIQYHARQTDEQTKLIACYKAEGREREISDALYQLSKQKPHIPHDLAYLSKEDAENYLHDMQIVQAFASANRILISDILMYHMNWTSLDIFETVHNYYDFGDNTIRKGAISATKDRQVLIPLNMRDGCILGRGKGNPDWNESAPHGAGRLLSRSEAKTSLSLKDFENTMQGIYSTSIHESTLDEAPDAYKPAQEIIDLIAPTVEVVALIKPVYNFKSH